jgi:hypothetical protein
LARPPFSKDGLLQVGEPPLQANGLPAHFTLGASSALGQHAATPGHGEAARAKGTPAAAQPHAAFNSSAALPLPDRMHVTLFFRSL